MPTPLTTIVAAFDTDRDAGRPLLGIVQGVSPEAAALPGQEDVGPARSSRIVEPAASADHRHQERMVGRLEIADHPHTVEAAVQKAASGSESRLGRPDAEGAFKTASRGSPRETGVNATVKR